MDARAFRVVRADEVPVGTRIWTEDGEHQVIRVRDLWDGRLSLTLRPPMGPAVELTVLPWETLRVLDS